MIFDKPTLIDGALASAVCFASSLVPLIVLGMSVAWIPWLFLCSVLLFSLFVLISWAKASISESSKDSAMMHLRKKSQAIVMVFIGIAVLLVVSNNIAPMVQSAIGNSTQAKAAENITLACIEKAGTNELSYDTIGGCKLLVCLIDNGVYNGLVYRDKVTACRVVVLKEASP